MISANSLLPIDNKAASYDEKKIIFLLGRYYTNTFVPIPLFDLI